MDPKDLEGITEVATVVDDEDANKLLKEGWKLIDFKFEKVNRFIRSEHVGFGFPPPKFKNYKDPYKKFEPIYTEQMVPCYFLAKFEE